MPIANTTDKWTNPKFILGIIARAETDKDTDRIFDDIREAICNRLEDGH